jgi:hypothetical protein
MIAYSSPGDQTMPSLNALGLKRNGYDSGLRSATPEIQEFCKDVLDDLRCVVLSLTERKLASAETGYLARAPDAAPVGDVVAVLRGCKFPVVLRRKGDTFLSIAECYVDGIMDGDIWDVKERGKYVEVEITIY